MYILILYCISQIIIAMFSDVYSKSTLFLFGWIKTNKIKDEEKIIYTYYHFDLVQWVWNCVVSVEIRQSSLLKEFGIADLELRNTGTETSINSINALTIEKHQSCTKDYKIIQYNALTFSMIILRGTWNHTIVEWIVNNSCLNQILKGELVTNSVLMQPLCQADSLYYNLKPMGLSWVSGIWYKES